MTCAHGEDSDQPLCVQSNWSVYAFLRSLAIHKTGQTNWTLLAYTPTLSPEGAQIWYQGK